MVEPLTITLPLVLYADTEMLEYVCNENEKDRQHIVGKVSDFAKSEVVVAPAILAEYAGEYVGNVLGTRTFKITAGADGGLRLDGAPGAQNQRIFAVSETRFVANFGYVEFVRDAKGVVSQIIVTIPEGDFKAERRR